MANGLADTPAAGWITVEQPDGILVRFAGPCEDQICSYLDVFVGTEVVFLGASASDPLPPSEAAAWRARRLVAESDFRACTPRYNTVVLPTEHKGEPAWVVYLLASSTEPDEVILTGHHRVIVSFDGGEILKTEPLSNSCLSSKAEESLIAPWVTHILHPSPIETHVFTSLEYHVPLYVGTETGTYKVEGARITLIEGR